MIRSLFTAVSGIRNHQHKLDVLGNNIANVNTVGFKGSRLTFADTFNQTLSTNGVSGDQFTNGKQIGTGVGASQIQTLFSQGMLEATGNTTDLAIQGKSFFVVKNNDQNFYSRDGGFFFDANRQLVNSSGMFVQGWTADGNGDIPEGSTIENIQLDTSMLSNPLATQNIRLTGNLSTTDSAVKSLWTIGTPLTSTDPTTGVVTYIDDSNMDTTTMDQIDQFSEFYDSTSGGYVFNFQGSTLPNGNNITNAIQSVPGNTPLTDFINDILDPEFAGVNVSLENGQLQFQDETAGESFLHVELVSQNFQPFQTIEGQDANPSTASVVVYDNLGEAHNVIFNFSATEQPGIWNWEAVPTQGDTITSGGKGTVTFNSNGSLDSFQFDDADVTELIINDELSLKLDVNGHNGISGLSSLGSMSTLSVFEADGRPTGTFENMFIEDNGKIIAQFTNGDSKAIAQLALASFKNPEGLEKGGQNTYKESTASGNAAIDNASNLNSSIISGALEMSNVDLANEFTDMIISQRGFQASTKVITATDQILQDAINLKR